MNISQRKQPVLFSCFPWCIFAAPFFCNFCIIMFFKPFMLQLCATIDSAACKSCSRAAYMLTTKLLVMPPRTTPRIWMQGRSREKWERVALKVFSEGEWRGNFLRSLTCRSFIKLCVMMEKTADVTLRTPVPPEMRVAKARCRQTAVKPQPQPLFFCPKSAPQNPTTISIS